MNEFDTWNNLKQKINLEKGLVKYFPKEAEIWISTLGKNIGFEQNGSGDNFSRPVLIVKKFNNNMFWTVPLSSKQKAIDFYFNYTDRNNQKVSAILAQMKLLSVKRLKRKLYDLSEKSFKEIKDKLKSFL